MTAATFHARSRSPSARISASACARSLRSITALPPRRRLYEMLGIQLASSRFDTYFGKFENRIAPKIGMSNRLW